MKTPRNWYRFQNQASDPTVAEIHIIDVIGDWVDEMINEYWGMKATVTAKAFVDQLAQLPAAVSTIKVHINSPGGDVFAALNIANALRDQQTSKGRVVETIVDGLAASAASIIMMAGSKVLIADNAMVMVHNPWSGAVGSAADMRKAADTLDAIRNTIVATYKWHSSLENDAIIALLDAETWMDAEAAVTSGFATEVIQGLRAAASIDRGAIASMKVPERFKARVDALMKPGARNDAGDPDPNETPDVMVTEAIGELQQVLPLLAGGSLAQVREALGLITEVQDELCDATEAIFQVIDTLEPGAGAAAKNAMHRVPRAKAGPAAAATDVLRLCREGECLDQAEPLIASGATLEHVTARVTELKATRAAATARATEIQALCAHAKLPELASGYIAGALAVDAVRTHLSTITARMDKAEIDAGLSPDQGRATTVEGWKSAFARVSNRRVVGRH